MVKPSNLSIVGSTTTSAAPVPAIVLCGPTGAGKSAIARRVAEAAVLEHLNPEPLNDNQHANDDPRLTDLRLLDRVTRREHPAVVESDALPRLLPVDNTVLVVGVVASTLVRARRLRALFPGMDIASAIRAVEGTDAARNACLRTTWGIDITRPETCHWQMDLVVGCPEPRTCPDESACIEAVTDLVVSAYSVYEHHLSTTPAEDRLTAVDTFNQLCHQHADHVRRVSRTLMNPIATDATARTASTFSRAFTPEAWRGRLLEELQCREGLL